ncbi:hypothetical protein AVEN_214860-1 [Araneus ventricosus]|uniref:Uncharacterized protein n=1 Tax=Araneus ventricosus TaxID=182803 RepID=A0A4Y2HJJ2_ARAVE|nr:hypothetical protein AVEN_214860-1 [Araneus ventricosus]
MHPCSNGVKVLSSTMRNIGDFVIFLRWSIVHLRPISWIYGIASLLHCRHTCSYRPRVIIFCCSTSAACILQPSYLLQGRYRSSRRCSQPSQSLSIGIYSIMELRADNVLAGGKTTLTRYNS